MKIGITGHQQLKDTTGWDWIRIEIDKLLTRTPKPLIGITSLAIGADQLFAEAVLQHGGTLNVIIPFDEYEFKFLEGHDRQKYHHLLDRAVGVEFLQKMASDEESYFESGKRVVDMADFLVAVWDGKPARGLGGTADVVKYAEQRGKRIIKLDPTVRIVTERS